MLSEQLAGKGRILVVEDDLAVRFAMRDYLQGHGHRVAVADSCAEAQLSVQAASPDLALIDYMLPDGTALDLMQRWRDAIPGMAIIVLTAHGSIDLAVRTIKEGAEQFLTKPVELATVLLVVERTLENQRNRRKQLAAVPKRQQGPDPFLGRSAAVERLRADSERVLVSDAPVLVHGETGTGKGVLARWLHDHGPRAEEPFVDLNCAGLSREFLDSELFGHEKGAFTGAVVAKTGLLEAAHRGTLFLDEIGDVDAHVQPKLLKVVEEKRFRRMGDVRERTVDVRIVAASHFDLRSLVREQKFRNDLYFRISALPLVVPPLRDRREDIPEIAAHMLHGIGVERGREVRLDGEAERLLTAYPWPGNIRELRNVLERAVLLSDGSILGQRHMRLDPPEMPASAPGGSDLGSGFDGEQPDSLDEVERRHILRILDVCHGRVDEAARKLAIPRSSLYQRIKRYGLPRSRV